MRTSRHRRVPPLTPRIGAVPVLAAALATFASLGLGACDAPGSPAGASGSASPPAPSSSTPSVALDPAAREVAVARSRQAEQRRSAAAVDPEDQRHRDPAVRVAAARALARIGGKDALPGLRRALSDEDPEVVVWAAYGLGGACEHAREATVSALVARSVALEGPSLDQGGPFAAIARAVGRCAAPASEPTLVAWLSGPGARGRAAALGLADLASAQKRLREETHASLLQLAQGTVAEKPAAEGLLPMGRLEAVPPSVRGRLIEVAEARLADAGPLRLHGVKALGRAGAAAAGPLRKVLEGSATFTPSERAEAVRSLARLGREGQVELEGAILVLAAEATGERAAAIDPAGAVLPLAVSSLERSGDAHPALTALASLTPPAGALAPALRRVAHLRCAAAKVIAQADERAAVLTGCDLTRGGIGERALVAVLARGRLEGERRKVWSGLLATGEARTREAALELLASHPEVSDAATVLAAAIASPELGVAGTAAELIAKHPHLAVDDVAPRKKKGAKEKDAKDKGKAGDPPEGPENARKLDGPVSPAVAKALVEALERAKVADDAEVLGSIADALGALVWKEGAAALAPLCEHAVPDVRKRTAAALGLLEGRAKVCAAPEAGAPLPAELDELLAAPRKIVLDTDVGELTLLLDPALAPVTTTRIAALVKRGYFDGKVVHRVVPGFVAQLGAPHADGWGGAPDAPSLRCETSPVPYDPLVVGMALAGRDTGSTQFFVTFARHPHLDGNYATIGKAEGPWESLVEGDVVRKAVLAP